MKDQDGIGLLREQMRKHRIDAYIIPNSDPHLGEYIPEYWKIRPWISGFTGSAGTFVLTRGKSALWTDSRYFLQAEQELANTGIEINKTGYPETPTIEIWLALNLPKGSVVGFDGRIFSITNARSTINKLQKYSISCIPNIDLISGIWKDRPKLSSKKLYRHEPRFAGASISEKLGLIRKMMLTRNATGYLLCALDEICWAFNVRGRDIAYNPVVLSYAYIDHDEAILFIDPNKVNESLVKYLEEERVAIKPYDKIDKYVRKLGKKTVLYVDPDKTNYYLSTQIPEKVRMVEGSSIVAELKSRKNEVEIEGFRQAMVDDGCALVAFLHWLENAVGKEEVSEITIAEKLLEFRSQRENFVGESFATIAGYKDHGAIVHYRATMETNYQIKPEGFLLIDSGGQYYNGTTDITRTLHLGEPTEDEMIDYTLVLKGMIQVSMAKFPHGTGGAQIDTLARAAMWAQHINYGHGTGHGVGCFLNVHEGPQQIRPENHLPIEPGMVTSVEPGLYRAGRYGIRIENLTLCQNGVANEFGKFLRFETLTLCPIDTKPIKIGMLTSEERDWLNAYHRMVYTKLSPNLADEFRGWLKVKTDEI
jgi:Xaa-Pro aminopeptidase